MLSIRLGLGISPVGGRKFNPISLGGLVLWLDSNDQSTITESGGGVVGWADKSGSNNSAAQPTLAQRPISGTRKINGRNVLDFNGTSHRMLLPAGLYSIPSANNTVFVVSAFDDVNGGQNRVFAGNDAGTNRWFIYRDQSLNNLTSRNGTVDAGLTIAVDDTSPHILGVRRNGYAGGVIAVYDGKTSSAQTGSDMVCTSLAIGAQAAGANYLDGVIGEVLIFNRALSMPEMNYVGTQLSQDWGTAWQTM